MPARAGLTSQIPVSDCTQQKELPMSRLTVSVANALLICPARPVT